MAVLNEHKNIAYRVQKWLMTRPANIVDSERPNEHGWTKAYRVTYQLQKSVQNGRLNGEEKVINFGVGKMQIQEVAKGRD